jgi:hypothetical protein
MHTQTLKKSLLALTFWIALHASSMQAQTVSAPPLTINSTGTNPVDFEFRADGTLIAKGNIGVGTLLSTDIGNGDFMLWFPKLGAFRAGETYLTTATTGQFAIGPQSVAFGAETTASGYSSTALGTYTTASGDESTALGDFSIASGDCSAAFGDHSTASGLDSLSFMANSIASGDNSLALGAWASASGYASIALGPDNIASGSYSLTLGAGTTASAYFSTASGVYTTASAYDSFVMGTYNIGGGNPTTWVATDPLFEVGNGTATKPSDALLVDKSGNVTAKTFTTTAAAGDIPMYSGN